jgi:REP element-mobilizing transposase RayT
MFIRKNNRLPNKSLYQSNHRYFITICTHNRKCILTTVAPDTVGHDMAGHHKNTVEHDTNTFPLTEIGKIIKTTRYQLPSMFWNIILDAFIIMPNHIHGIIWFDRTPYSVFTKKSTNLWNIIKRFKLETINQTKKYSHLLWSLPLRQKSFHDHIIRNQEELIRIQEYIINNHIQRNQDSLYTPISQ